MQERCASRSPLLMKTNPAVIRTVAAPFSAASMEGRSWTVMGDSRAPCRTQAGRAAAEGRPGRIERACARPPPRRARARDAPPPPPPQGGPPPPPPPPPPARPPPRGRGGGGGAK